MDEGVVKFYCPKCRQKLSATNDDMGQAIQCPVCNTLMRVPRTPPPEPPSAAEPPTWATPTAQAAAPARARAHSVPTWALFAAGGALLIAAGSGALAVYFASRSAPPPTEETWKDLPPPPPRSLHTAPGEADVANAPPQRSEAGAKPVPAAPTRTVSPAAPVVPPRTGRKPPVAKVEPPTTPATVDLPVEERKRIFAELMDADTAAAKAAVDHFPDEPMYHLAVGDRFLLSRGVPLLPARPPDGVSGVKNGGTPVRSGVTLEVVDVKPGTTAPWYQVRSGADAGGLEGWLDAVSLAGQSRSTPAMQATKRREFQARQLRELREAIGTKHGLTSEQIAGIFAEGIENWQTDDTSVARE